MGLCPGHNFALESCYVSTSRRADRIRFRGLVDKAVGLVWLPIGKGGVPASNLGFSWVLVTFLKGRLSFFNELLSPSRTSCPPSFFPVDLTQ